MPIRLLSPDVASKIAAGEVVERPASVVKELLENSIDSGATEIRIQVQGGGVRFIQVSDNGSGIPAEEVDLALQRHATSKIASAADLEAISTLGFRGEALPSIAAVAELSILTRTADNPVGTYRHLRDGATIQQASRGCPVGTTVTVRNLFRNVPARLKFLRSTATEGERIVTLVSNYALAYPEVKFSLTMDSRHALDTPGTGLLKDALVKIYGVETAEAMLEIVPGEAAEAFSPAIKGYISPPNLSRANRSYIVFFVNRRWVQSRLLTYALEQAYQGFLMVGRHPIAILDITLPHSELDVNVHPAKSEVRFRNEGTLFSALQKAVRETLLKTSPIPSWQGADVTLPPAWGGPRASVPSLSSRQTTSGAFLSSEGQSPVLPVKALPILRVVGQIGSTYMVAEGPDGLYLIDQHAAHERVLYERLTTLHKEQTPETQGLLEPVVVELTPAQEALLHPHLPFLSRYGFSLEPFGERSYLIRSMPLPLTSKAPAQALREFLDATLGEGAGNNQQEKLIITLACHSAVRAGDPLSQQEMESLVRQLEETVHPNNCPHGRPTMIHLSSGQLERQFGRRGA